MATPINPLNRPSAGSINSNSAKAELKSNADTKTSPSNSSEDTVSLSQESQQVIELQQHLKSTPEIDSAKVEAIKQEIANGNYPLDPEKIAQNLFNLEQSLIE